MAGVWEHVDGHGGGEAELGTLDALRLGSSQVDDVRLSGGRLTRHVHQALHEAALSDGTNNIRVCRDNSSIGDMDSRCRVRKCQRTVEI